MSDRQPFIAKSADIHPSAKIAENVFIAASAYIGENVEIGEGCRIEPYAVIQKNTRMGKNNHIYAQAVLGGDPQHLSYKGEESWLVIGDNNIVREHVTLNRGSHLGNHTTSIGNNNTFFAGAHVAHDCCIGNHVLFVNYAGVTGHVTVEDYVILGAYSGAHQFSRIGAYSFLLTAAQVKNDIPPYMMVSGEPAVPICLNAIGLRRHGFSSKTILGIKKAFRLMYRQMLPMDELKAGLAALAEETPEIQAILDMINTSKRGIVRKVVGRVTAEVE